MRKPLLCLLILAMAANFPLAACAPTGLSEEDTPTHFTVEPTPTPTAIAPPSPAPSTLSQTLETDSSGDVTFLDSLAQASVSIHVQDENERALEGVEATFFSRGDRLIVVAVDPQGVYAPGFMEGSYEDLALEGETTERFELPFAPPKAYACEEDQVVELVVAGIVTMFSIASLLPHMKPLAQDPPDFAGWNIAGPEFCGTPEQLSHLWGYWGGVVFLALPTDEVFVGMTGTIGTELVAEGIASGPDQPILVRINLIDMLGPLFALEQMERITSGEKLRVPFIKVVGPCTPEQARALTPELRTVQVPDLDNGDLTVAEATEIIEAAGLVAEVGEAGHSDVAEGFVFEQDPEPGAEVLRGSSITIHTSLGPALATGTVVGRCEADEFYCNEIALTARSAAVPPDLCSSTAREALARMLEDDTDLQWVVPDSGGSFRFEGVPAGIRLYILLGTSGISSCPGTQGEDSGLSRVKGSSFFVLQPGEVLDVGTLTDDSVIVSCPCPH